MQKLFGFIAILTFVCVVFSTDCSIIRAQEGISAKPLLIERPELPKLPKALKKSKAQGIIILKAMISVDGLVTNTEMINPSGLKVLDEFIEEWVHHWHYFPRIENGEKVDGFTIVTIRYDLENQKFIAPQPEESAEEAAGRMQFEVGAVIKPAVVDNEKQVQKESQPVPEPTRTPLPEPTQEPSPVPTATPLPQPPAAAAEPAVRAAITRLIPVNPLDPGPVPEKVKALKVAGDTKFYFSIKPDGSVDNAWALSEKSFPELKQWIKAYLETTQWQIPDEAVTPGVITAEIMVHFNLRNAWVQFEDPRISD